ncbi:MAG TPA: OmpA family protein [Vicinamibacterales bacterium]|jgi:outer membrane protein OmpA-like peptidoglycan-associated protein|nr:OmpA family protein [Vicinamibacterales bacterium]
MRRLWIAALLGFALISSSALAQVAPNPTQHSPAAPQDPITLFRVTVVGHTTPAINYRPRHDDTPLDFAGTALLPKAEGHADISGEKGYIRIDAKFDKLDPATRFGPEYLTYVMWAITPEGRATNLGELQVKGDDGRLKVTTELQAFALIVTAEPYFAVTQPSDVVVMENVVRKSFWDNTNGRVEPLQAKYELLKRGAYLMNADASSVKWPAPEPGVPLDLAQAHNAVEIARLARADQYAAETYNKAARLVAEAEEARRHHKDRNKIMMPARQAAQTAEDARIIALQRQEQIYQEQQRAAALQRENEARERARVEEERRLQAEQQRLLAEQQRLEADQQRREAERQAEQQRLLAEQQRQQAEQAQAAADAARAAAERDRLDAEQQRAAAEQQRADADRVRAEAERARLEAEAARAAAETQAQQARSLAEQSEREKALLRDQLRVQLNTILETRETARGLVVNVSDVLFDFNQANLKPGARDKVAKIAAVLRSHPDLKIQVEGHTDSVGSDEYNVRLSERRAESVRAGLVQEGVHRDVVGTAGFGESKPVATNGTAAGRQQNRRVEIIVSGESIGTAQR